MHRWVQRAPIKLAIVVGVALAWNGLFSLNSLVFAQLAHSSRAHWIFLPAALRVLSVLMFGYVGAVGLMVGAYFTLPHAAVSDLPYEFLLSLSSGLAPLTATDLCGRVIDLSDDLSGLRGKHIILLSVASAFANSVFVNGCMIIANRWHHDIEQIATIFVGDMLGTAIVLTVISIALRFMARLVTGKINA